MACIGDYIKRRALKGGRRVTRRLAELAIRAIAVKRGASRESNGAVVLLDDVAAVDCAYFFHADFRSVLSAGLTNRNGRGKKNFLLSALSFEQGPHLNPLNAPPSRDPGEDAKRQVRCLAAILPKLTINKT